MTPLPVVNWIIMKNLTTVALFVFTVLFFDVRAQQAVHGRVRDAATGLVLWGASVQVEGSQQGTLSDAKGRFHFASLPYNAKLTLRYVGYEPKTVEANSAFLDLRLDKANYLFDEVVVKATRAESGIGMPFTNISAEELRKQNLGQDIPMLLQFSPSIVSTSDAGAGIGYTGIRIRGTDATRVNVTINGIPINDSESQGLFWVNMPDFASSVASVQIQRGVGTSTNGAGAFGGSVNLQTNEMERESYAEAALSAGSFQTLKSTLKFGTGLMKGKWTLDGRLSRIVSDGFIDRASSNLRSFYISGAYFGAKSMIRLNYFTGKEKTYQSWYGTPESRAKNDVAGMKAYIERNWLSESEAQRLLNSDRRYNFYIYDNQTDNYAQDHVQLITQHQLNAQWNAQWNAHYTYGRGYYEEFREGADLSDYRLAPFKRGNQMIESTDLIRQKWLDNDFYGTTYALNYEGEGGIAWTLGGAWNQYLGRHFGELVGGDIPATYLGHRWYQSQSTKTDFNVFSKLKWALASQMEGFLDLQYRQVGYLMSGTGDRLQTIQNDQLYQFFNPKLGINYRLKNNQLLYASLAYGSKEPSRQDFTDNPGKSPRPEFLRDLELGYQAQGSRMSWQWNAYYMDYKDQLVLTGAVNATGDAIRVNVPRSYRLGLEAQWTWALSKHWKWQANATLSDNRILSFVESIPDYDTYGEKQIQHGKTHIAFSPSWISGSTLTYTLGQWEWSILSKWVGKQYLDNTSNPDRALPAYWTQDLRVFRPVKIKGLKKAEFTLLLNNVLNHQYASNGYTYSYIYDAKTITENFWYPQAGFNFLAGLTIRL